MKKLAALSLVVWALVRYDFAGNQTPIAIYATQGQCSVALQAYYTSHIVKDQPVDFYLKCNQQ